MVAAAIRTIFAQPDPEHVRSQLDVIAGMLGRQLGKVETMLRDTVQDITAFADFGSMALPAKPNTGTKEIANPALLTA
jgi:hypothetical protein